MKRKNNKYIVPLGLALSLAVAGCTSVKPLQRPEAVALPAAFPGQSDTATALNLKQVFTDPYLQRLIDTALLNNPDLQTALQRVEGARANFLQTRGALRPSVQAMAAAGVDKYGDYTLNGVGNFDTNLSGNIEKDQKIPTPLTPDFFLGLRSSWEIDLWGKLRQQKSAAYHRLLASQQGVQGVRTLLVSEVATRYFELLALDDELEVLRQNIHLQQRAVEVVEVQKLGGRATELAVHQFKAQLLHTRGLETDFRQQIQAAENELNLLLGRLPQRIQRSESILKHELPQTLQAGIPSALLLRRPDIRQAELELKASEADVQAARAAFLPSLTLTPYLGLNAFSAAQFFNPASLAYGALGGLAGPVLNRTANKAHLSRSTAASREAFYGYQKAILSGYREVVTRLSELHNLQRKFTLKQEETETLRAAVATANDLYRGGYATYLEVISAQKGVVEAELELIATRRGQLQALVDLYRALGGG
ncbi:efflux transporter outer membrane subunit [Paraflavisolibacter sp. H34]|uniref:efflux transporter outer membrane subunit n=1 Tax=Huijunlia imazamoxiresistens TaxID=3127457 RepID=UPI00301702F6